MRKCGKCILQSQELPSSILKTLSANGSNRISFNSICHHHFQLSTNQEQHTQKNS